MIKQSDVGYKSVRNHMGMNAITYPRDESLIETCDSSSGPNGLDGLEHCLGSVGGHLRLEHL